MWHAFFSPLRGQRNRNDTGFFLFVFLRVNGHHFITVGFGGSLPSSAEEIIQEVSSLRRLYGIFIFSHGSGQFFDQLEVLPFFCTPYLEFDTVSLGTPLQQDTVTLL